MHCLRRQGSHTIMSIDGEQYPQMDDLDPHIITSTQSHVLPPCNRLGLCLMYNLMSELFNCKAVLCKCVSLP